MVIGSMGCLNVALNEDEIRYNKLLKSNKNTCAECSKHKASCISKTVCNPVRKKLRNYGGLRFTSDGFDCALPVTIDSHSVCSFGCLYCFSDNLIQHRESSSKPIGQMSLKQLEAIFSGKEGKKNDDYRKALKYDRKVNGYPCPIQVGGICDPLDNIERQQGWFLKFVELCKKYNQPARISTKGNLFLEDDYINAVADRPELFWVAFSIISRDDEVMMKLDKRAPPPSERIECMQRLNDVGVKTSLRFRPLIPGISDSTKNYPECYKDLIRDCAKAGAKAISYETVFVPGIRTKDLTSRWREIEKISGKPLISMYESFGKRQFCIRPSYEWTEAIMNAVYKEAKKYNLDVGVSDPTWKQLTETGCCCGILPDDPVFGNWERENATNALLRSKKTGCEICLKDITPEWSKEVLAGDMVNSGVGPTVRYKRKYETWSDKLQEVWNNLEKERSPLNYFQGALQPTGRDKDGNLKYKYVGLKRKNKKNYAWKV